jgi:DNA gyrase subunit A
VAMALLEGIDEDTVDFVDNYDGYEREPVVLPARLPNLLVNGSAGIAVGMATNIPPHNLGEVVDALLHLLDAPGAGADELMAHMPAPDFPTGARIVAGDGLRTAFETGRGAVTMEAIATTETRSGGMPRIVVTEIPYQVNKAALLEKIAGLVKERKIDEIRDLRDESSRDGMRIVIELKRGEDPAAVLTKLYAKTDLRSNFHVNLVALVDGTPRTLGVRDCLEHYLEHQREVVTRRTSYRRARAAERAHVLEGLLVALDHLDEVIALIRAAESADVARGQLMERYDLTEVQATAILDMQLRRLAQLEREKIAAEHRELTALIAELDAILADPRRRDALLAEELRALRDAHANPRRSRIQGADDTDAPGDDAPLLDAQQVAVYVTRGGWLKPVAARPTSAPHSQPRDPVAAVVRATTEDTLLLIDADGGGYRVELADVPVTTMRQRGVAVGQLLGDPPGAPIVGAAVLDDEVDAVATVSAQGLVKRSDREEYLGRTRAMIAAGVRDDDAIVAVLACRDDDELLVAHSGGLAIRFPVADVRSMGRSATGVAAITLPARASVVAATVVPVATGDAAEVLLIAADGRTKRTRLAEFPTQGRGGKGVQTGARALAWCGLATDVHVTSADQARVYRTVEATAARRAGRFTSEIAAPDAPVVPEAQDRG